MKKFTLHDLEKRVAQRAKASAASSYTRALLDAGVKKCAAKLGEEARETARAAVEESPERLTAESADLLYHLLVVLKARKVRLRDVEAELFRRTRQSGHAEKASRNKRRPAKSRAGRR
jgi:phosphoribosyl-ATP pyrophosphohydrolase